MVQINVVFFASLREKIGMSSYSFDLVDEISIEQLKQTLATRLEHGEMILADGIQSSIDFEFTRDTDMVTFHCKEVAFFPPVTGG